MTSNILIGNTRADSSKFNIYKKMIDFIQQLKFRNESVLI